jgi:hypothetical protein
MLLCGIVDELKSSIAKTELLCYFFCQATDSRINNATAVLRGLMYLLIVQLPSLISHIGTKYEYAGKALFEDSNAWDTLSELFTNILQSLNLNSTYLIVDALDECVDFPKLLDFIVQMSSMSSQVKWIVSSNNRSDIEAHLEKARDTVRLCLELNTASISTAVRIFIEHKMLRLANKKHYDRQTYNSTVNSLYLKAENNFLWVALVCGILEEAPPWNTPLAILATFPPGLEPLYQRMMKQIWESEASGLCKQILALVATENQPMSVAELASRVKSFIPDNVESLYEIISFCNPFINIREDKIYFVHQSAKDFLFAKAFDEILSYRKGEGNQANNQAVIEILSDSRLKHSEKDSGYASASRPQTFSTSSEEPFQDNNIELPPAGNRNERKDLHDNEIESLPSDNDDTGSQASNETTNEEMAGKALLRVFLANEPQFRSLCEKAMTEMGNKRFVANMQRLLKSFHRNLLTEAEAETEKAIAKLLRSKRGRLRISQQLSDHIQQEREEGSQFDKSDLRVIPEYKNRVETWLAFAPERSVEIGRESQSANSGYSTSTTDDSSEEEFPHISKLEKFLCRTRSFQLLLKDCMLLFLPFQTRHLLSSIPKECIWVSSEQDLSISNRVKAWVEDFTQVRWNWLPLESRKRRLRPGESRIFWRCVSPTSLLGNKA